MKAILSLLIASLFCVSFGGCTNKADQMEAQLMQHDAEIRRMQPVQADAWNQVQSLREEVQELRGQIADLKRIGGSAVLVDKLNRHDEALRQIETAMALKFDLGEPINPLGGNTVPAAAAGGVAAQNSTPNFGSPVGGAGLVLDPSTQAPASSLTNATAASAAPTYGGIGGYTTPKAAPTAAATAATGSGTWGQATPRPKQPTAQKDMSVALYDAGVNAFNARKYTDAQRSFSDFLQNYGSDPKASQAQYYLAECYFQTNQFADAALAYDTVITKYPDSSRAPGAYLKQGICFSKLKQNKAARARMNELIKKFPQSPEAARAKTFLKTNS